MKDLTTAASFSASAITGDEPDAAHIDEVCEADLELLVRGCEEKLLGFDLVAEGCWVRPKCLRYMLTIFPIFEMAQG